MKHNQSGCIKAVQAHCRSASVHQRAIAKLPIAQLKSKKNTDAVAGPYLRAHESYGRLRDIAVDVVVAVKMLDGTAASGQPVIGQFSEQAHGAMHASAESKTASIAALRTLLDSINDALTDLQPVLQRALDDAKLALVKHVAADALDTKSLHHAGGAGLQLIEGTIVHRHMPAEVLMGHGGLTADGEKKLASFVMKDYRRALEDQRIISDEYADADRRAAEAALKNRARSALAALGVQE